MTDASWLSTIKENPIKQGLDNFRSGIRLRLQDNGTLERATLSDDLDDEVLHNTVIDLLLALQALPACRVLPLPSSGKPLLSELSKLNTAIIDGEYSAWQIKPLLIAVLSCDPDYTIWTEVHKLLEKTTTAAEARPTTPPPSVSHAVEQGTPWSRGSNCIDSAGNRVHADAKLKAELRNCALVDHPSFFEHFFGKIPQLDQMVTRILRDCSERETPLLQEGIGWVHWPVECKEAQVLVFLRNIINDIERLAREMGFNIRNDVRCITSPNKYLTGSSRKRKLDFALAGCSNQELDQTKESHHDWSKVYVLAELKSNSNEANSGGPLLDLARYVVEIYGAQDTRRFVLGFTLCGPMMRILEFDRTGVLGSELFDINQDARRFVSVILGFLSMTDEQLGFDPTIKLDPTAELSKRRYIDIERNGRKERIFLRQAIIPQPNLTGRGTTCIPGFVEHDPCAPLMVKTSWEYERRPHEGLLLEEATKAEVNNVAKYYWHEDVQVNGTTDDVQNNIRGGLDNDLCKSALRSISFKPIRSSTGSPISTLGSSNNASSSALSPTWTPLGPSVQQDTTSPTNRVHRRLIMIGVGKHLYDASSPCNMLRGLLGGLKGHEGLYRKQILHRDISIGNILLEEREEDGFLIDFDLGIKTDRLDISGVPSKTGTKVFMAINALYGRPHTFMEDLESFFWVLFWVGVHWNGSGQGRRSRSPYEGWNYKEMRELADIKQGKVLVEDVFAEELKTEVTDYCKPLIPCIRELRRIVFPSGTRWLAEEPQLYSRMRNCLEQAIERLT